MSNMLGYARDLGISPKVWQAMGWWAAMISARWKTEEQCQQACDEAHKVEAITGPMCCHSVGFKYVPCKRGKRWVIGEKGS